jgi:abortive infection bacteriophage resistance protein
MCVELLYIRELSLICKNLKKHQDRVKIAKTFYVEDADVFCSWLHSLSYVRNICAHHARLWDIKLAIQPKKLYNSKPDRIWLTDAEVDKVHSSNYYFFCMILYLLQTINPNGKFKEHFVELLHKFPTVDVRYMGFPENWKEHPLWKI